VIHLLFVCDNSVAIGTNALPLHVPIEIEMIAELLQHDDDLKKQVGVGVGSSPTARVYSGHAAIESTRSEASETTQSNADLESKSLPAAKAKPLTFGQVVFVIIVMIVGLFIGALKDIMYVNFYTIR
jgi:hypothetical protein